MSLLYQPPYREISLVRNNDRDYFLSWEDSTKPIIPNFSGGGLPQRALYDFTDGTQFLFTATDDLVDIQKAGTWDDVTKEVKLSFVPGDTVNVTRNRRVYYEMDAVLPNGKRYTVLTGYLVIFATKNLNA